MKNKMVILVAVLTLSLCLTACDNSTIDSSSSSEIPISSADSSSSISSENSSLIPSYDVTSSEVNNSEQLPKDNFPESFTGYLGETLHGIDASEQSGRTYYFDGFTYLRWATSVFDNTLKTPDLINWDTYDMPEYNNIRAQKNPEWFLVKPGDVLENGLVVKSASCGFEKVGFPDGTEGVIQSVSEVTFENTLTLSGVLYCEPEDDLYVTNGDLFFFADSTANSNIPVISEGNKAGEYSLKRYVFSNAAFVCDGMYFRVGELETAAVDLSGIIKRGEICEVRVTLDNIKLSHDDRAVTGAFADIVSIEKIND